MDTEMITTKTVVDLAEKTSPVDTDLFMAGDAGSAALKKFKWSNLLAAIKTKIAAWTFETLNTSNKTIVGAVNELNNNTLKIKLSTETYTAVANTTRELTKTVSLPDGAKVQFAMAILCSGYARTIDLNNISYSVSENSVAISFALGNTENADHDVSVVALCFYK